ncbi:uncharacterized protein LOC131934826 [Physella acuta]|uniref:uncharacterized protein LOC131934826 n=1 Tax=Physella acuta TaxID=109671 RepID=UPI0027DE89A8|nr:uncharacterized protein LOC131934826 [Physella acuta]
MEFTNIFNTCPANETVGNLPCDDIISGITGTTTIEPDLGYTFVLDVLGACFNVTVIEVNGKRIDYGKIIKKLKFEFTQMKTNRTELDENYDRNVMSVEIPSEFVVEIIENNTRLFNVKEFTNNGLCDWLRDWRGKELGIKS